MTRNSQQRRANNKRLAAKSQRNARSASAAQIHSPSEFSDAQLNDVIVRGACFAYGPRQHQGALDETVRQLVHVEQSANHARPSTLIHQRCLQAVAALYEAGWQPLDVAHTIRRTWTQRASRLGVGLIAAGARVGDAAQRAPHSWLAQLADLGVYDPRRAVLVGGHDTSLAPWARTEALHPDEMIAIGLQVLGLLLLSPRQSTLIEPPSKWARSNRGVRPAAHVPSTDVDPKALKLIRALLAKAEATNFEAEADAFTAKAQDLMTRYSIDAAVVAVGQHEGEGHAYGVKSLRVHIESPYAEEKAGFLAVLADVNNVRAIWSPQIGISTLMGFPVDIQLSELLFTSLLFQATRASADATAGNRHLRTASFRRAFLVAYAERIGERLRATKQHASTAAEQHYGAALVPLLADRQAAIDAAYEQAFPNVTVMKARQLNANGWYAGRAAADLAKIGAGAAITSG